MLYQPFRARHPVVVFFVLTFLISWGAILALFGPRAIPATADLQEQVGMVVLLGPAGAGLLLTVLFGGWEGLRQLGARLLRWRIPGKWYGVALLIAPLATLATLAVLSATPAIARTEDPAGLISLGLVGGLTVGLLEELGWTGFATPRLTNRVPLFAAGALIGLCWGGWHFILFWAADSFTRPLAFFLLLARLFSWLPAYRILMVWVYEHTQSLFLLLLMHASLVASLAILDPVVQGRELLLFILVRAGLLWALVALVMGLRRQQRQPVAADSRNEGA
jgi:membrane protease YdiL (CAAX protease family)